MIRRLVVAMVLSIGLAPAVALAATLSLYAERSTYYEEEQLVVAVLADTSHATSDGIVAVDAIVQFDTERLELLSVAADDPLETDFHYPFDLPTAEFPARSVHQMIDPGQAQVVAAVPGSVAIPAGEADVAVAHLLFRVRPLSDPVETAVPIVFVAGVPGTPKTSHVLIDDGDATDVLTSTTGLFLTIDPDRDDDGVRDSEDNCPTVENADQADQDADGVGDLCDNCVEDFNPRLGDPEFAGQAPDALPFQQLTGGQLDDDGDGYGNQCDAKFGTAGQFVGGLDITEIRSSFNKDRSGADCGTTGDQLCAQFDLDNAGQFIGGPDVTRARALFNLEPGPKCEACPLPNLR